jgi:hypothetical protein
VARGTSVNVVGAMLELLAAQPASGWVNSPLRTIYAAPGPPAQRDQLEARFRCSHNHRVRDEREPIRLRREPNLAHEGQQHRAPTATRATPDSATRRATYS